MESSLKPFLRTIILNIRHILEGYYTKDGEWISGDLEKRIRFLRNIDQKSLKKTKRSASLSEYDRKTQEFLKFFEELSSETDSTPQDAIIEYIQDSAFAWMSRLFALRCMEVLGLIEEIIIPRKQYENRSLQHNRFLVKNAEQKMGSDEGFYTVLFQQFQVLSEEMPAFFNPTDPRVILLPSYSALQQCIKQLSDPIELNGTLITNDLLFKDWDSFGWAYQYWNSERKEEIFKKIKNERLRITGSNIIPVTQLYTEPYMVKFLVYNSLGTLWMQMKPQSNLSKTWDYYCPTNTTEKRTVKPINQIKFLDPACGSGHFLVVAFDLFYNFYLEENPDRPPSEICNEILNQNLYGLDIDNRAIEITKFVLLMKAKSLVSHFTIKKEDLFHNHIVGMGIRSFCKKDDMGQFLTQNPDLQNFEALLTIVFDEMKHISEWGSLLRIEECIAKKLDERYNPRNSLHQPFGGQKEQKITGLMAALRKLYNANSSIRSESKDNNHTHFLDSAHKSINIIEILSQKYDIIATNPPFMGTRNMGPNLRTFLNVHYSVAKRDLYAAFILRCYELADNHGFVAMITQQTWMFLGSYNKLRNADWENLEAENEDTIAKGGLSVQNHSDSSKTTHRSAKKSAFPPNNFRGILKDSSLQLLAHLGPNAFQEIGGEVVNILLFILTKSPPVEEHIITALRLIAANSPEEKEKLMLAALKSNTSSCIYQIPQKLLISIPFSPIVYWIKNQEILELLKSKFNILSLGGVRQGLATGKNPRFVRYNFEIPSHPEWRKYTKGGGYCKWVGLNNYRVDYRENGALYDKNDKARFQNTDFYFRSGITYSLMAQGALGLRLLDDSIFDIQSMSIFPDSAEWDRYSVMAVLNSYIESYLARIISLQIIFNTSYVSRLPLPRKPIPNIEVLAQIAVEMKRKIVSTDFREDTFVQLNDKYSSFSDMVKQNILTEFLSSCVLHTVEGIIESKVNAAFGLTDAVIQGIYLDTGIPSGLYPLLEGYEEDFKSWKLSPVILREIISFCGIHKHLKMDQRQHEKIIRDIRYTYENGEFSEKTILTLSDVEISEENSSEDNNIQVNPIPSETHLEQLSKTFHIHPISLFQIVKTGIETANWRNLQKEKVFLQQKLLETILRLCDITFLPPLTRSNHARTRRNANNLIVIHAFKRNANDIFINNIWQKLGEHLILGQNNSEGHITAPIRDDDKQFIEAILQKSLINYINADFFDYEITFLKKRPILWQIQSQPLQKRKGQQNFSAFSCFIYYHALNSETIMQIITLWIQPILNDITTELDAIIGHDPAHKLTESQNYQVYNLQNIQAELLLFKKRLLNVLKWGFSQLSVDKITCAQNDADIQSQDPLYITGLNEPLDNWTRNNPSAPLPLSKSDLYFNEVQYKPNPCDGVRINIAPFQKFDLLSSHVLSKGDVNKAIEDRAIWRADERKLCRLGKITKPLWWI